MVVIMYIERMKSKRGKKIYTQILLRESYRVPGLPRSRVKHRTLMNLSWPEDIRAIEWGLKHKLDLNHLDGLNKDKVRLRQGFIVGAVFVLWHVANQTGLIKALGKGRLAKLGLWLVFAGLIGQGSRLSAVRLAQRHAVCEIMGLVALAKMICTLL